MIRLNKLSIDNQVFNSTIRNVYITDSNSNFLYFNGFNQTNNETSPTRYYFEVSNINLVYNAYWYHEMYTVKFDKFVYGGNAQILFYDHYNA